MNRPADALAAYEQAFVEAYRISDRWMEAQTKIVETLRKLNRQPEALQAARICFDACSEPAQIQNWTGLIMDLMREIDKDVVRANQFLAYQQFGPAGKDQTPGTPDDIPNPLAAVPYPSYPAREQAFAKARATAGDSARASRHRAMTFVFTGKPGEALKYFADGFRRCTARDMRLMAAEMVVVGVRGVQGHPINLDRCFTFMASGPAGSDGKIGTPDDRLDPFQSMGIAPLAPGSGGLAEIPADQIASLKDVVPRLEDMAQYWRQHSGRRDAIAALARVHTALCDWGAPGQKEWYIGQLLLSTPEFQNPLMDSALASAKGGALCVDGIRQFQADSEMSAAKAGIKLKPEGFPGSNVAKELIDDLEKPHDLKPKQTPFPPPPKP